MRLCNPSLVIFNEPIPSLRKSILQEFTVLIMFVKSVNKIFKDKRQF